MSRLPFTSIPSRSIVLGMLPPFRRNPLILYRCGRHWLAFEEDAKRIAKVSGTTPSVTTIDNKTVHWLAYRYPLGSKTEKYLASKLDCPILYVS